MPSRTAPAHPPNSSGLTRTQPSNMLAQAHTKYDGFSPDDATVTHCDSSAHPNRTVRSAFCARRVTSAAAA